MEKTTWAFILRLPAEILLIGAFLASAYVKFTETAQISWGAVILLLIINVLYFIGRAMSKKNPFDF